MIFYRPKQMHLLVAEGGPKGAVRSLPKHAAQVTVIGEGATLTANRVEGGIEWTFTGPVKVEPGTACEE